LPQSCDSRNRRTDCSDNRGSSQTPAETPIKASTGSRPRSRTASADSSDKPGSDLLPGLPALTLPDTAQADRSTALKLAAEPGAELLSSPLAILLVDTPNSDPTRRSGELPVERVSEPAPRPLTLTAHVPEHVAPRPAGSPSGVEKLTLEVLPSLLTGATSSLTGAVSVEPKLNVNVHAT
jgi:hypothetical protein